MKEKRCCQLYLYTNNGLKKPVTPEYPTNVDIFPSSKYSFQGLDQPSNLRNVSDRFFAEGVVRIDKIKY